MFTITNQQILRSELFDLIDQAVANIEAHVDFSKVEPHLTKELKSLGARSLKLNLAIEPEHRFDAQQDHDTLIKHVTSTWPKGHDMRKVAYEYINVNQRRSAIAAILTNPKKISFVVRSTIRGLIQAELGAKRGVGISMSELINKVPLKVTEITLKNGSTKPINLFGQDELKTQLISELAELDLIDVSISQHTHMCSLPKELSKLTSDKLWDRAELLTHVLDKKTILTEPMYLDPTDLITRSSWYYRTPNLSPDQIEFVNTMHSIKYQFVDNALDLIADAYLEHLKDDNGNLPEGYETWVPKRIQFFKAQIKASQANGGHYIAGKFDSSLRWYMQAEIGHMQTSPALRALVKVADIQSKVKYDFKNNVVQMYATLMKVRSLAKYVGLVPEADREEDIRWQIAKTLNSKLEVDIFCKDNVKPLFMVWAYNAGKNRILDGVTVEEEGMFGITAKNVKVPGLIELTGAANTEKNRDIIWSAFEETVVELAPAIVALKQVFKKLIKHNPLNETQWTLPDGAIAQYASPDTLSETLFFVDSKGKQHQHTHYRKMIVENVKSAGLLPRVIHSFDAYVARQLVIRAARLGITIVPNHDSFTFDSKHEQIVFDLIEQLFIELLESDHFGLVVMELNKARKSLAIKDRSGTVVTDQLMWDKYGKLTVADLLQSNPVDLED